MTKIRTTTATTIKQRVCTLAYDLAQNQDMTSSEAMRWAWFLVKNYPSAITVTFAKKNGETTTRLVENWTKRNRTKGTGRTLKPGQRIFTDMDKHHGGLPSTISTYTTRIISTI